MEMAAEEAAEVDQQLHAAVEALQVHLVPRDEADSRDVILEVRAGAGT